MRNLLLLLSLLCVGCGGGGGGYTLPAPMPTATPVGPFAVVGDSISAGHFGSTFPDFPNAWPAFVGRAVVNVSLYGGQEPNMAKYQVPLVPSDVTTVVYEGGTNDVADSAAPDDASLVARIDHMVAAIHAQAPKAQVVLMTVRHLGQGRIDNGVALVAGGWTYAQLFHREMVWNDHERSLGLPIIDVQDLDVADADLAYPDGVHPSLAQAHVIAQMAAAVLH